MYSGSKLLNTKSGSYEIDLTSWFKHIHDTLVTSKGRDLKYYPDFMYQDRWKYFIKFDHPVKIVSVPENVEIAGQLCAYKFNATQVQPDVIMLESSLVIKSESVSVSELNFIENSFKAIAKVNNSRLIVSH